MLFFHAVEKLLDDFPGLPKLANDLHSFLASIRNLHLKEVSMRWSNSFRAALLLSIFFVATAVRAQSQTDEIGPLPTALTTGQLQLAPQLNPVTAPELPQPRARRRLAKPPLLLSPEELSYREAVRKFGVDKYHFVRCELPNGKVRTGVITEIRDEGFTLKDGIIIAQWISYTDLKAAPRPVAAVGTRIGQGFKWAGVGLGVAVLIPLIPFMFLVWDGC
jgi:hypothetical protein